MRGERAETERGSSLTAQFTGKVIVITGGAGGIGRATALRFAQEGASVAIVDVDRDALNQVTGEVERVGAQVLTVHADVSRSADVERYVTETVRRFGGIDYFFNNAGIEGVVGLPDEYPEDVFDRVLAVNVKGVWLGMKHVAPAMRERGGGAIVNTASIAGLRGRPATIAYGASKHAVIGMTKSAALAFARDRIRVNAICPSPVETRMMRSLERASNPADPEAARQRLTAGIPLGRYATPEEVSALVAFLCSDDASFITGGIYPIDGGSTA